MEKQLKMITEGERVDSVDILSTDENDRRNKIVEAHQNLSPSFQIELTSLTANQLGVYNNSITNWETAYEDFKKDFKLDTQTFKVFAKEKLQKQQLDENTIEQIIKGIISHHTLSMTRDSSFYKHLVEGIHAKRSDLGLTSGDKCALESNIGKAIKSGFACAMSLTIKN